MNNFESYFEKASQDLGIALFFIALLPIVIILAVKAYKLGVEVYTFFNHRLKKTGHSIEVNAPDKNVKSHKLGWHFGRAHADA